MSDPEREQKDREIRDLKEQVAQLNQQLEFITRQLFGRRSEKGIPDHPDQLQLFEDDDTKNEDQDNDEDDPPPASPSKKRKPRKRKKPRLPEDLPVEEEVIDDPDEVKTDPNNWKLIGQEKSDRLAFDPPRFYIKRITRNKYAWCGPEKGIIKPIIAPLPPQLIDRGIADASFAAHVVISKYSDHLPLDRQAKINRERYQVDISKQTLCNTVGAVAEWLSLIVKEMSRQAFDSGYVQADETPIKYLKPGSGQSQQGYLWTFHAPMIGNTVYYWRNGRGAKHLKGIVPEEYQGIIQCDGYSAYPNLRKDRGNNIDLCGCLAHIRRKFYEALEQGQDASFNNWILRQIQALYKIEKRLRRKKASSAMRLAERESQSRPIFNRLLEGLKIKFKKNDVLPKSLTGKALSYALNQLELLSIWLGDGRVEIDNNLVENKIRPTKLGAKNWLFIGSDAAGWRSAVIYSIITSCRNHGIEPYSYMVDVLRRLPSMKTSDIWQVLPSNWRPMATCG